MHFAVSAIMQLHVSAFLNILETHILHAAQSASVQRIALLLTVDQNVFLTLIALKVLHAKVKNARILAKVYVVTMHTAESATIYQCVCVTRDM